MTGQRECKIPPFPPAKQPSGQLLARRWGFHPGPQGVGRPIRKAWALHLPGHATLWPAHQPPTQIPFRYMDQADGLTTVTCQRGKEPEARASMRWLRAPRILPSVYSSSGYFPKDSAGPKWSCQWMAQVASDHMENLSCCFDSGDSQEDGNYLKGFYALLRFYVPNLLKISPRFFLKHIT